MVMGKVMSSAEKHDLAVSPFSQRLDYLYSKQTESALFGIGRC